MHQRNKNMVISKRSSDFGPQQSAVHGHASHPLWDLIQKPDINWGYRPGAGGENPIFLSSAWFLILAIGSSGSHYSQQRSLQLTPQSASRFQKIQHERQHQLHQPQSMRMLVDNPEAVKFVEHALMSTNHGSTSPYSVGAQRRPR